MGEQQQEEEFKINNNETQNHNHTQKQHRLLMQQSEEIQELKDMLAAAVSELKRHNPGSTNVDDLKLGLKNMKIAKDSDVFSYGKDGIVAHEDIIKIKQLCDDEINRYKNLYDEMDRDYHAFKTKTNKEIQQKDECYLNELA